MNVVNWKGDDKTAVWHAEIKTMLCKCFDWFEMEEKVHVSKVTLLHRLHNLTTLKVQSKSNKNV